MNKQDVMILEIIKSNPFFSEQEISERIGLPLLEVSEIILSLIQSGTIIGRAFVLPKEKKVLCIGGANVDKKIQVMKPLSYGTSNPARSKMSAGGVARNIAENLGRIGLKASLLTCIGDDPEGKWLVQNTENFVDISHLETLPWTSTGTYTAVLDETGEMAVALADMAIYDLIDEDFIERKWQHLQAADIILLDTNFPANAIARVIERCKIESLPICIATVSAHKVEKLPESLEGVTWLIANQKEAEALAKLTIESEGDLFRAAEVILEKGADNVVITRGEKGLIYFTKDGEAGALLPLEVPVMDVTGAGDSLIAGILFGYLNGLNTEDACKVGMTCSMITVQSSETVNSDLNKQKLLETFQKYFCKGATQR